MRVTSLPNQTSPETVKWSNSSKSGIPWNRLRNSFTLSKLFPSFTSWKVKYYRENMAGMNILRFSNTFYVMLSLVYIIATLDSQYSSMIYWYDNIKSRAIIKLCGQKCELLCQLVVWQFLTGVVGKERRLDSVKLPFSISYKFDMSNNRSEVFLTGKKRERGTTIPKLAIIIIIMVSSIYHKLLWSFSLRHQLLSPKIIFSYSLRTLAEVSTPKNTCKI